MDLILKLLLLIKDEKDIFYVDIKPDNILVEQYFKPVIIDLGLAV
jgi:hypothetical protein